MSLLYSDLTAYRVLLYLHVCFLTQSSYATETATLLSFNSLLAYLGVHFRPAICVGFEVQGLPSTEPEFSTHLYMT